MLDKLATLLQLHHYSISNSDAIAQIEDLALNGGFKKTGLNNN
jgi:hypothetical protein